MKGDITNPRLLKIKGVLFLTRGLVAGGLLLAEHLEWRTALPLARTIWAFCRFYYFAFHVLHHYADPSYNYAGLIDLARYLMGKSGNRDNGNGGVRNRSD